jgi:phospholipid-binding lipoprotein MlaA
VFGFAGMVDRAEADLGWGPVQEDFGQTLGVWGAGEGAYLVLPVLGPSNIRDGIGLGVDTFANPLRYVFAAYDVEYVGYAMTAVEGIDLRARNLSVLDEIERTSIDFYAALRSLYRQRRNRLISNGEIAKEVDPLDDPFAEPRDGAFVDPFGEPEQGASLD